MMICFRLLDCDEPARLLLSTVSKIADGNCTSTTFIVNPESFRVIPNAPFAYWVSARIRKLFSELPAFEGDGRTAKLGASTKNDFRFLRLAWEVPKSSYGESPWRPHAKGGAYSPFYSDISLMIKWDKNAKEIEAELLKKFPYLGSNAEFVLHRDYPHLKPGLTWPPRTQKGLGMRALPAGCVFGNKGPAAFIATNDSQKLCELLAITTSKTFRALVEIQMAFGSYEVGVIQRTVLPRSSDSRLEDLARKAWTVKRFPDTAKVDSHAFYAPALTRHHGSLNEGISYWTNLVSESASSLASIQSQIDSIVGQLYGLDRVDQRVINAMLGSSPSNGESRLEDEDEGESDSNPDATAGPALVFELLDYIVGVAFGRWDIRYAKGELAPRAVLDPFAALPLCPAGMLINTEGSPAEPGEIPTDYPIRVASSGILVDDEDACLDDVVSRIESFFEIVWEGDSEGIRAETCWILDVKSLRDIFRRPNIFFSSHLKRYSRSRRQAPIYWQLSAGSGSYSAWLYYHRFTQDTLYRVLRDFVEPRIQQAEREQFELESQGALSGDAATRLQEAQTLLQDLRLLKSELDLVAPLWNPNLNDGVIINHAILWRITPYTPWQKKCMECWDKLVRGDYDWAHLAFHLWPERVIPKCVTDRSLAIAHGLEERLWQETNNGNWLPRQLSEADLQALIAEHSNPAVKSALERFLAAPPPVAPTRTRASRSPRASGSSTPRRARGSAAVVHAEATRQVLLALTAAPSDGLAKTQIADLIGVEANALTAVIKQLKESGQIDQLGERRGARYVLSEQGRARLKQEEES
jgi:hypothetical protein